MHIDKQFLEFMPVLFLIWPFLSIIPTFVDQFIKNIKFIFRLKSEDVPVINSRTDLNKASYETIIPSLESSIRRMNFFKFMLFCFVLLFLILPIFGIIAERSNNGLYFIVILIYGIVLLRYIKCYFFIRKNPIRITNTDIKFPIFGLFRTGLHNISFQNIEDIIIYGSNENLEMTLDEEYGAKSMIDSGSVFMQGIYVFDTNRKYYVFSDSIIPFEELYKISKKASCDKVQLITEFN